MTDDKPRCSECGERINEESSKCACCGYNPAKERYNGPIALIVLGSLLTLFIVTAIIGLPMFFVGLAWAVKVKGEEPPKPYDE